ncbi:MAG TPA: hypothetical protein VEC06_19600 [Paucimonas sp.]|nr:hypothetical protein [Paucimonas sp.]
MTAVPFRSFVLRAHLALRRFGWGNAAACLLAALVLAAWLAWIPRARSEVEAQRRTLADVRQAAAAATRTDAPPPVSANEERLRGFYAALGEHRYAEQQIKTLFAAAAKTGLTLDSAEYKHAFDKNGGFHTYQIALPIKGSYAAVRRFCEQALLAIPFASLDQAQFKREAIAGNQVEARLRFTLYLAEPDESARARNAGAME